MVVPPMGTAFPGPCTSQMVNAICEVRSKEGYVMGRMIVWFHLGLISSIPSRMILITYKLEENLSMLSEMGA